MKCAYDSNGDKYTAADFEEPTPVEWDVTGTVSGARVHHYIKAVDEDSAEEKFRERYEECIVNDVEVCLSDYQ